MTFAPHPTKATRRRTNVSIDAELLRQAKELGIGLSSTLEAKLAELIGEARRREWLERNGTAIDAANRYVERHGLPLDEHRQF